MGNINHINGVRKMKLQQLIVLPGLVLTLLIAGCAGPAQETETPLPLSTATLAISTTPSFTTTPTPIVPTQTPTAVPTLPEEQAQAKLLETLANNGGCRLPCLWGITPGKSTYQEAGTILMPVSSLAYATYLGRSTSGSVDLHYTEDGLTHYWDIGFISPESGVVNHIRVMAAVWKEYPDGNLDKFDSAAFGKRAAYYSLSHILSEQGMPASVIIHPLITKFKSTDKALGGFHILLIYPDRGLFVHYTTYTQVDGAKLRGCPANAHIELELYPAGDADGFTKAIHNTDWAFTWPLIENPYWKSIEDVTSMTLEQFYGTFRQPTDKCIETPAKVWPTPEP